MTLKRLLILPTISFAKNSINTVYSNMSYYGFNPTYLTGNNFAESNGIDSEINSINISIPQGSCLRSQLFTIYINDPPQTVLNSNVSMYADDTGLCYQLLDMNKLKKVSSDDLKSSKNG